MTAPDPRSRPAEGHETPLDGTATIRTDATVHPHDADALDAWLESADARWDPIATSTNQGDGQPNTQLNGHRPSTSVGDMSSLVATTHDFHRRIGDAERKRGPAVPETEIWERILNDHLASQPNQSPDRQGAIGSGMALPRHDPKPQHVVAHDTPTKRSTVLDILTGTHPAVSILLAAAVILAILAIFRVIGAPPSGPTDDPAIGYGPDANPSLAAASPNVSPVAQAATPSAPEDGTLLIDNGFDIVSRPLDGSSGMTLETYGQSGPPTYTRTTVPDVVIASDGKTAQNVRTGQVLGTNPYESAIVIGPFWVQYTSQNPAVPVDARIVDLRTMEIAGFFDLAGVDPAGLGPQWLIEGTASGILGVGFVDRAYGTGPTLTPTMLLIDGDLERTRVVPLWSPRGTNGDVLVFSPDGSLVAYLTGTEGKVVIRVETIAGEPIGDIPWPDGTPVAHLVLPDAQTLLVMSEGQVLRADLAAGTGPAPIAEYTDEIGNAVLSPDGSHLLFATLDPLSGPSGYGNMAWHWLDIGTGDVRPIPQATGGSQVGLGPSIQADVVMLWVPVGPLGNGTYRVLFVDVTTGAVTVGQPTSVTSGFGPGEPISRDGAVFAAYGSGSPEAPRFRTQDALGSIPLNGQLTVFDSASRSVVEIPFPDIRAEIIDPAVIVSPDGRHVVLSVRWTNASGEHAQSWITTTDGQSAWTPIEGGLVIDWVGE